VNSVCITIDVDWAPEPVLADTVELLDTRGLKATFFATGPSQVLEAAASRKHEVGLHPSYQDNPNPQLALSKLKQLWPEAKGVRAHGLASSSALLKMYVEAGLEYNCDFFVPDQEILQPYLRLNRLVCLPFCWEDDVHFRSDSPFQIDFLGIERNGLLIYSFHPVHIYLNTNSDATYRTAKPSYQDPQGLLMRRARGKGVRTLFLDLLDRLIDDRERMTTTGQVAARFRHEKGLTV